MAQKQDPGYREGSGALQTADEDVEVSLSDAALARVERRRRARLRLLRRRARADARPGAERVDYVGYDVTDLGLDCGHGADCSAVR